MEDIHLPGPVVLAFAKQMSIKVYIKDKALLDFPDEHYAVEWIEAHPEMYDGNLKKIQLYSDEPIDDLLIATEEVTEEFQCQGCGAGLKFVRHPKQTRLNVGCPACGTTHTIHAPDVSSPPESGDED